MKRKPNTSPSYPRCRRSRGILELSRCVGIHSRIDWSERNAFFDGAAASRRYTMRDVGRAHLLRLTTVFPSADVMWGMRRRAYPLISQDPRGVSTSRSIRSGNTLPVSNFLSIAFCIALRGMSSSNDSRVVASLFQNPLDLHHDEW